MNDFPPAPWRRTPFREEVEVDEGVTVHVHLTGSMHHDDDAQIEVMVTDPEAVIRFLDDEDGYETTFLLAGLTADQAERLASLLLECAALVRAADHRQRKPTS